MVTTSPPRVVFATLAAPEKAVTVGCAYAVVASEMGECRSSSPSSCQCNEAPTPATVVQRTRVSPA